MCNTHTHLYNLKGHASTNLPNKRIAVVLFLKAEKSSPQPESQRLKIKVNLPNYEFPAKPHSFPDPSSLVGERAYSIFFFDFLLVIFRQTYISGRRWIVDQIWSAMCKNVIWLILRCNFSLFTNDHRFHWSFTNNHSSTFQYFYTWRFIIKLANYLKHFTDFPNDFAPRLLGVYGSEV